MSYERLYMYEEKHKQIETTYKNIVKIKLFILNQDQITHSLLNTSLMLYNLIHLDIIIYIKFSNFY